MTDQETTTPAGGKTSPLASRHEELGANFTDFGGWQMPLKYDRELTEHRAVREQAGIFDLSHMGELRIVGPDAGKFLNYSLISNMGVLKVGKAKYSMIVDARGGIIDDLITYRLGEEEFLVVPNAANTTAVFEAFTERAEGFDVTVTDESTDTALIAIQGPRSEEIVAKLLADEADREALHELRYYASLTLNLKPADDVLVARTGYTGEDGFELIMPKEKAGAVWDAALAAGEPEGLIPCGLAARDSLRLEAAMSLYGNELSRDLTPVEAGLGMLVSKKKEGDFYGRILLDAETPTRVLAGFTSTQRRAARSGAVITNSDGTEIGTVTSGQPSPTLGHPIALGYVDREYAEPGTDVTIQIRGKAYPFEVTSTPFYKRKKSDEG